MVTWVQFPVGEQRTHKSSGVSKKILFLKLGTLEHLKLHIWFMLYFS